jgi:hypothetical protein
VTISPGRSDGAASLLKGSVVTGVANALINGAIQAYLLQNNDVVPLTEGRWAMSLHSVAGKAVMMAALLAMILTLVGHLQWKGNKRPFWPTFAWLSAKHGLLALAPSCWHHPSQRRGRSCDPGSCRRPGRRRNPCPDPQRALSHGGCASVGPLIPVTLNREVNP